MLDFLDERANADLNRFVELTNEGNKTSEWITYDRKVSQWIEHGRITDALREHMSRIFRECEAKILGLKR